MRKASTSRKSSGWQDADNLFADPRRPLSEDLSQQATLASLSQATTTVYINSGLSHDDAVSPFAVSCRRSLHAWNAGRARRHSRNASQPPELRRVEPLAPATISRASASPSEKSGSESYSEAGAQTAAGIWQARRGGGGRARGGARSVLPRWCQKGERPMRPASTGRPPLPSPQSPPSHSLLRVDQRPATTVDGS